LVDWCLLALSAPAGYSVPQKYDIYCVRLGDETTHVKNETIY